jgi:hypothetical protein
MVHAAAIRSTGMSACLGIAERVMELLGEIGVQFGSEQALSAGPPPHSSQPWWSRSAAYRKGGE